MVKFQFFGGYSIKFLTDTEFPKIVYAYWKSLKIIKTMATQQAIYQLLHLQ